MDKAKEGCRIQFLQMDDLELTLGRKNHQRTKRPTAGSAAEVVAGLENIKVAATA